MLVLPVYAAGREGRAWPRSMESDTKALGSATGSFLVYWVGTLMAYAPARHPALLAAVDPL